MSRKHSQLKVLHAAIAAMLLSLLIVPTAGAAIYAYVDSDVQGHIQGDVLTIGYQNWIDLNDFSHGVVMPTDPDGLPLGNPITSPVNIGKLFDRSTIGLTTAVLSSENLSLVRIDLTQMVGGGVVETYYRIELENAKLVSVDQSGNDAAGPPFESFEFTYAKIILRDLVNETMVSYNWNGRANSATGPLTALPKLEAPAPNPTPGLTEFSFSLPVANQANLSLFDVRGRRVRELHDGWTRPEPTVAVWDGTDDSGSPVAQGVYLVQLTYPGAILTQRVVLLR